MSGSPQAQLTERCASLIEANLRSSPVEALSDLLWKLRHRWHLVAAPPQIVQRARELELIESASDSPPRLTPLGAKVSDSLTEYVYWKQRGRRHHGSLEVGALAPERLCGKRILEVGCGAGVNLLSLQSCAEVVGVDVEPLYLGLGKILASLEGLPSPRFVCAPAESLPFEDGSFDVVLFHGSLQYMRIESALGESARVLRPGGRTIAICSDFTQAVGSRARQRGWKLLEPRVFLRETRALMGMAVYPWAGRLLVNPFDPIHVTRRQTRQWLRRAGLCVNARESCTVSNEVCFVADKPAAQAATRV